MAPARWPGVRLVLLLAVAVAGVGPALGALISSSSLEECTRTSGQYNATSPVPDVTMACKVKMVVTLAIPSDSGPVEAVQTLPQATGSNGSVYTLQTPMTVQVTKTQAYNVYPIYYVQNANNKPYELSIIVPGVFAPFGFPSCDANWDSSSPTCGFAHNATGAKIYDSQGFCCACSLGDDLGVDSPTLRGAMQCDLFGNAEESAHCLRFDSLWYSAFTIGPPQLVFDLYVSVNWVDGATGDARHETLLLGPTAIGAQSSDGSVIAQYLGETTSGAEAPTFDGMYLFVPVATDPTNAQVASGSSNWMIINQALADLSGLACNKIGVSYVAFSTQSSACEQPVGSCLLNQLKDYYMADRAAQLAGERGNYFVSVFGEWAGPAQNNASQLYIRYLSTQLSDSLVVLQIDADAIEFVTNVSPGEINYAEVADFQALTRSGIMRVLVTNTGSIEASYSLRVACSADIEPIDAQSASIAPLHSFLFTMDVITSDPAADAYYCDVSLIDSLFAVLQSVNVTFSTNATQFTNGPQSGTPGNAANPGSGGGMRSSAPTAAVTPAEASVPVQAASRWTACLRFSPASSPAYGASSW